MCSLTTPGQRYKERIDGLAGHGSNPMGMLSMVLEKQPTLSTRVTYLSRARLDFNTPTGFEANIYSNLQSPEEIITVISASRNAGEKGICIIENISPIHVSELGAAWDIDPEFFARHVVNPPTQDLWVHRQWQENGSPSTQHLHGVYECNDPALAEATMQGLSTGYFDRVVQKDPGWPVNVSTTLSYCDIPGTAHSIYLLLVDPQIKSLTSITSNKVRTNLDITLRFPYTGNRGGLFMPLGLIGGKRTLFDNLEQMLHRHPWQLDLILRKSTTFPGVPFLYLVACSIYESDLRILRNELNQISFSDVRRPDWRLTDGLHDIRQALDSTRTSLQETVTYEPTLVEDFFTTIKHDVPDDIFRKRLRRTPLERLHDLLDEANQMHRLVLETFDILIGTIAVLDSKESRKQTEESLKQTRQTILLTGLATIYLPLSLATSVFGMNLKEMTDSGPHVWTFVVTAVALVAATITIIGSLFSKEIFIAVKHVGKPDGKKTSQV